MDIDLASDRLDNMIISNEMLEANYFVKEAGNVWYVQECQQLSTFLYPLKSDVATSTEKKYVQELSMEKIPFHVKAFQENLISRLEIKKRESRLAKNH